MGWTSLIYLYDGTFYGFLTCVYESYTHREKPCDFLTEEAQYCLYPVRNIITDREHADRVYRSLQKYPPDTSRIIRNAFLTCLPSKENHLYQFIAKLYSDGPSFLKNSADPVYHPIAVALRNLSGELEKYRGFVRFSDYNGVLYAEITPKNRVLPLLRGHFCDRFYNENFAIFDKTNHEVLLHEKRKSAIIPMDAIQLQSPDEKENYYRGLWVTFFESISIKERYNPKCQNTQLPKRYRKDMVEFTQSNRELSGSYSSGIAIDG